MYVYVCGRGRRAGIGVMCGIRKARFAMSRLCGMSGVCVDGWLEGRHDDTSAAGCSDGGSHPGGGLWCSSGERT